MIPLRTFLAFFVGFAVGSLFLSTWNQLGPTTFHASFHANSSARAQVQPSQNASKIRVVIASYWRSGSGFLGEIFNQHPDAFYLVEPLNGFIYPPIIEPSGVSAIVENKNAYLPTDFEPTGYVPRSPKALAQVLSSILDCRFDDVPAAVFMHRVMKLSRNAYQFNFCLSWTGLNLPACRPVLSAMCAEMQIVAVKEVYARAETLLQLPLDTKVIHLVRDPRAVSLSQRDRRMVDMDQAILDTAKTICNVMSEDIRLLDLRFDKKRYLRINYEQLAEDAVHTVQSIFEWLGTPVPPSVLAFVDRATASKANHGKARDWFSATRKKNSTMTAHAWKRRLRPSDVAGIDDACQPVYKLLGYNKCQNEPGCPYIN